jgi:hypothetical protein
MVQRSRRVAWCGFFESHMNRPRRVAGILHQPGTRAPRLWARGVAVGTATARAFARHRLTSRGPWRCRRGVLLLLTLMLTLTLTLTLK